jgi:acyl-coenzyme A synthetase/AMP-(fatty) acid ligase
VADVVLRDVPGGAADSGADLDALKGEILELCREGLAKHKVPTAIRVVPTLAVAASGKLARHHA